MSKKCIYTCCILIFGWFYSQAQVRSTNETNVIVIVHKDSNQISTIELYKDQITEIEMLKKYPNNWFFLGLFKGNYELINNEVMAKTGSVITIFTEKLLFSDIKFLPNENITIGNIRARVLSSKKGELILKTM